MIKTGLTNMLDGYMQWLYRNERSAATVQKYLREVQQFLLYLSGRSVTREDLLAYREQLKQQKKAQSVNCALSAINSWLTYSDQPGARVRFLKVQRSAFLDDARRLGREDYNRLLAAAARAGRERLRMIMMTLGGTGIRISELRYITVEAVRAGRTQIRLKGKFRDVLLHESLRRQLLSYADERGITSGVLFRTRSGRPVDRSNICHEMKRLSEKADVDSRKVFPHSFRHLFAREFYAVDKNLARLADVLGHSSIETTRIYVAESAKAFESILNRMQLFLDAGQESFGIKIPQNEPSVVNRLPMTP